MIKEIKAGCCGALYDIGVWAQNFIGLLSTMTPSQEGDHVEDTSIEVGL